MGEKNVQRQVFYQMLLKMTTSLRKNHHLDMVGVTGSIPVAPTKKPQVFSHFLNGSQINQIITSQNEP